MRYIRFNVERVVAKSTSKKDEKIQREIENIKEQKRDAITALRKDQITRAAYRVVSERGYYNFTIQDIARAAGLSTGLIHHYFKDKETLLVNLLKEMQRNIGTYLQETLERSVEPLAKLEIFIDQAFGIVEREKDFMYVLFDFWTQIKFNERMRNLMQKLYNSYRDVCSSIIREGKEAGVFGDIDDQFFATVIISLIQGTIEQYLIDRNAFNYRSYSNTVKELIIGMMQHDLK